MRSLAKTEYDFGGLAKYHVSYFAPDVLAWMGAVVHEVNEANGWHEQEVPFPEAVALLHSEVSEALEAWRAWGLEDQTAAPDFTGLSSPKPEGVGSEFADLLIRLLHYSELFGIDLHVEFQRKLAYNRTRGYRHGGKRI
jgi:NTP pyrophosphatase (non-canonical NTP hydrolase)